jgi:hypothetical protein
VSDDRAAPTADWYADPTGVADLRYWDGSHWTEHVYADGVQSVAPQETTTDADGESTDAGADAEAAAASKAEAALLGFDAVTVLRQAQPRDDTERALDVFGGGNWLGRFVPTVDGSIGYRLEANGGTTVLAIHKPGFKNEVLVERGSGSSIGTIAKVGRLHSRYDVVDGEGAPVGAAKLAAGVGDSWELRLIDSEQVVATIVRHSGEPDPTRLSSAQYEVLFAAAADDHLRRLSLAVPVAIDMLDTQAV